MVKKDYGQTVYSGAQETTVNSKSFIAIFCGWITNTCCAIKLIFVKPKDIVYVNPDISIESTSAAIGVISYSADSRGNARIKLILPENCTNLNLFRQTPYNTEFLVTITGNHTDTTALSTYQELTPSGISYLGRSTENVHRTTTNNPVSTQTETSMSNLSSTRNVHQTTTNNYGSIQMETSIHGSRKSAYQTDEDEASSTQSENSIHGSRKSAYQTDEDEASSTQSENSMHSLGSMERVEKTNEYETSSGQSKKDIFLERKNERKSMHSLGSMERVEKTNEYETSSGQSKKDIFLERQNERKSMHSLGSMERVEKTNEYETSSGQSKKDIFLERKNERKKYKRINNQGTAIVALKWDQARRFPLNQNKVVFRHTAEYQIEGGSYNKNACYLYINERGLFSPATFRHLLENSNNNFGRWSLLSLSKSENHLHIERIDDLPLPLLYKITEPLQNHKDGKQRKRLGDMLRLEVENDEHRAKHPESELRRISPTNSTKGDLNIDYDIETDNKVLQNLDSNILEERIPRYPDVETDDTIPQNLDSNIPEEQIPRDQLQTVSSKEKQNEQLWTERTKMKQTKVKTRSEPTEFKIYLQSQDDEVRDLTNDFFRDDSIRHCVHDFFERDVDRTKKGDFERPHIQWPSMHPRLPFKLRYLDEHVEDSENGNQDHVQQQQFTPTASGEYNEESCSDRISVKSDNSDDEMK